jgi:hypothetical protein
MLDETAKSDSATKSDAKSASGGSDSAPANYSRGEGQKLVTRAYRENWLAIFGKPARKTASPKRAAKTPKRRAAAKAKTKSKTKRNGRR